MIDFRWSADRGPKVSMLASVVDAREALLCLEGGADVIDCKDPAQGALGAVAEAVAREVVEAVGGRAPVSATIGDLPCETGPVTAATLAMAATGVDFVKIGLFGAGAEAAEVIRALGGLEGKLGKARLVGVLFADQDPDFGLIAAMADAGFAGVVLDTADKAAGRLPQVMAAARLEEFVGRARAAGLFCGLAGSLRAGDIAGLARLSPDLLGFRGALCREYKRTASLDGGRIAEIRAALAQCAAAGTGPAGAIRQELVHEERA